MTFLKKKKNSWIAEKPRKYRVKSIKQNNRSDGYIEAIVVYCLRSHVLRDNVGIFEMSSLH